MKFATLIAEDGTATTVAADCKPLGSADIDKRVLHILPKLFVPSHVVKNLRPLEILLEVECSLPIPMLTIDDIVIRQPYPNTRYYVGGSKTSRNGWLIDLPADAVEFDLIFKWEFFNAWKFSQYDELLVNHTIHVKLLPGDARTYTMDSSCWPRGAKTGDERDIPFRGTAISLIGLEGDEDPREKTRRDIIRINNLVWQEDGELTADHAGQAIEENLTIPPVAYEQVWSLRAFDEEQLHEVKHAANFTVNLDEHLNNAEQEMPAAVLLQAIKQACDISFGKDSDYMKGFASCEKHPALVTLNQWWEQHRTDGKPMKAGHAMPWIRVKDDDEYWCGYGEVPNSKIPGMLFSKKANVRVGDGILLVYCAAAEHFTFPAAHAIQTYLTDGQELMDIGGIDKKMLMSGEYDEAWYALEALSGIPSRFPKAFASLQGVAAETAASAAAAG